MLLIYRLIFLFILILSSPFLLLKALWGRHGIKERLGFIPIRSSAKRLFWFHAASVGELKALATALPEIRKRAPDVDFAISTTTATGNRQAQKLFGDDCLIFLQPLELRSAIGRAIKRISPSKLIVVETELWPLMLNMAHAKGIGLYLINARLSERSFRFYKIFRPIISVTLGKFSAVLARSETDSSRYKELGAQNATVIGNIKYDQALNVRVERPELNLPKDNLIFVAGSIRRGEDEIFAELISRCCRENMSISFILVPRHMKDVSPLLDKLKSRNIVFRLWTNIGKNSHAESLPSGDVLVIDTMGELLNFYSLADIAFVGGSLVPIGGHDPLEPASLSKPVLFGPYMNNAKECADLLLESGGALRVESVEDFIEILRRALTDKIEFAEMGKSGHQAILKKAGVSSKIAEILVR